MTTPTPLVHNRESVRELLDAYADKIESFFSGLGRMPGNPYNVQLRKFGSARTAVAQGHDWLNRATLIGDESFELLDEVIAHFSEAKQRCHVEWNPGNCYRINSWNAELGAGLIARGFQPGGFRCVWHADVSAPLPEDPSSMTVRRFGPAEKEELLTEILAMKEHTNEEKAEAEDTLIHGQCSQQWSHYVGYMEGRPCCTATMFENGRVAYLDWAFTVEPFRGRGCQNTLIRRRLIDAHQAGCSRAASVTDVGLQSARNLQGLGFQLAYNYVMLFRDPVSLH